MKAVSGGAIVGDVHMVVHKASGEITRELRFSNLVLDGGYKKLIERMASSGMSTTSEDTPFDLVKYLWLGTGTTEPTFSDSGLENRSGSLPGKSQQGQHTSSSYCAHEVGYTNDPDNLYYECWYKLRFAYAEGEAEGVWTELGLGDAGYSNPFTRALIRDDNGDPISLTVLSDEYLTVFYTVRFINEPQELGSIAVDGQTSDARFIPAIVVDTSTFSGRFGYWNSYLSNQEGGKMRYARALVDAAFPYSSTFYPVRLDTFWDTSDYSSAFSPDGDYSVSGQVVFDPTDSDIQIECLSFSDDQLEDQDQYAGFGYILFDPPLNKRADYRLTLDIDIDLTPHDGPAEGLGHTATSSSLDFTWDAYPNVTEYQLILRQAGTVIEEQTVTSESASFTGLTADTEYHLDIKPIASPRNGRRLIYAATTEAA